MRPSDLQRVPEFPRPEPPEAQLDPLRLDLLRVGPRVGCAVGGLLLILCRLERASGTLLVGTSARLDLCLGFAVEEGAVAGSGDAVEGRLEGPFYLAEGPDPCHAEVEVHVSVEAAAFAHGDGFGAHICLNDRRVLR